MFDWLFEGRAVIYSMLAVFLVITAVVWWVTRKRGWLYAAAAVAALAGVYFVLSLLVETPRKQVERNLNEMSAAVRAHDADGIFRHVAADFKFRGRDRASFRTLVELGLRSGFINELVIYGVEFPPGGGDRSIPVEFMAKPKPGFAETAPAYPVKATFVRESDGQWRMKDCEVYDPVATKQPLNLPNLP